MNLLEALARQVTDPSLPGPMGALPRPLRVAAGLLPATRVTQLLPALMGADQGAARALTGGGIAGMALLNRAGLMHTTRANQADLANLLAAFQAAQGNPYERAQATNEAFAGEHGGVQSGILNTATDPLNMVGPAGKLAEVAQLHRLAQVLDAVNTVQNVPGEALAQVGQRALRPILQAPAVRESLGGLGDRLAQAVGRDTQRQFDTSLISKRGDARGKIGAILPPIQGPSAPPPVQPLNDLLGAARKTGQPNALEQLTGAGQRVAARDVTPVRSIAQIEAAIPKATAQLPLTAATPARPLDLLPREAVTPVEEAVARANDYGPASALADLNPVPSAAPDFPTLTGDRREILKRLSPGDLRKLVSTAYNDVPKAISNAFNARPDPVDLAERSIERITTNDKLVARLQQRDPHLAALLGALPDPQPSAIAEPLGALSNVDIPAETLPMAAAPDTAALKAEFDRLATAFRTAPADQKAALLPQMKAAAATYNAAREAEIGTAAFRKEGTDQMGTGIANALKPLKQAFGVGEDAAGGGGFGLTPGGLGLLPDAATRALLGAGGGGLLGAASGAASGYTQGDRGATLLRDATAGGAVGVGIGGGAGAAFPQLERATVAALEGGGQRLATSIFGEDAVRAAIANGKEALVAADSGTGARLADLPAAVDRHWRAQVTATFRNFAQDAANVLVLVKEFGKDFGASSADVEATRGAMAANLRNPDKVARYGDLGTLLQDIGHDNLIEDKAGLQNVLGVGQITEAASHASGLSASQRVAAGAGIGYLNSAAKLSPLSPLIGGIRGKYEPFIQAVFGTLNGLQHDAPRVTFLQKALEQDLPQLGSEFLAILKAQGVDTGALDGLGGRFSGDDIKATLAHSGHASLATQAAKDWQTVTEGAIRYRSDRIAHLFGDFREGATPKWQRTLGKYFPFASWSLKYAPVLAEIAARHPAATAGLIGALARSAASVKAHGEPSYRAGTIPISTEMPVLGGGARVLLGGKQGTARVNPVALLTGPFGGEFVAGPEDQPADATLYQRATGLLKPLGLSPHPLIQAAAYATGQDYSAPGSLSRTAGLEQLPQLLPGALGTTIPSGRALLDAARKQIEPVVADAGIATTGPASASDPVMKRYAELVFATTGKPIGDRSNAAYLEGSSPEAQALHDQALRETVLAGAASNATSLVSPVSASGTGADAEAAQIARQPVLAAQDQVDQLPPVQGALLQQQIDQYKQDHPQSAVYDGTSQRARAELLLADWERQNAMLGFFPDIYNYQRQVAMEQLGLLPPGTLAGKQRALDASGQATALPGVANTLRVTPGLADALRAMNQPRH